MRICGRCGEPYRISPTIFLRSWQTATVVAMLPVTAMAGVTIAVARGGSLMLFGGMLLAAALAALLIGGFGGSIIARVVARRSR
ncbi:MAG: hypothetical protein HY290_30455 [Planctomycetia bacterium]|nr:hypothetical protein [Planctomycetia bacterium]